MNQGVVEIKAFVPARDFALSKRFYQDLGFEIPWSDDTLAYMRLGDTACFLQNFYVAEHAGNFMMHLLVEDVESWWAKVVAADIAGRYGVRVVGLQDQPWAQRDFVLFDPSGVLWRIAQNTPPHAGDKA
ncbi:MAG: glyoxalase [Comamonadaceae bacterium]|nr:MAG: glyoxalase [Comamonadaceae bacterium]